MTKSEIFDVIQTSLREILPELDSVTIDPRQSMRDLGANSVDRADVVLQSMETLKVNFPLYEVAAVENLQGLVDFLYGKVHA